jgi:hypothetical protein
MGDQYYSIKLDERFEFVAGKADSLFKEPERGIAMNLSLQTDKPEGFLALTNARIITMNGNEVIEDGTIFIDGNKISAIGKSGEVAFPATAQQIDCKGKTIMPGFIDAHAHANHFRYGITPQKHWPYYANLAYGVTTMHDPSANSEMVFAQSELVKAGLMVGPRVFCRWRFQSRHQFLRRCTFLTSSYKCLWCVECQKLQPTSPRTKPTNLTSRTRTKNRSRTRRRFILLPQPRNDI